MGMRAFAVLAVLSACTAPAPVPDPVRVEPSWGVSTEDTRVRVIGTGFYPSLSVDANAGSAPDVDDGFAVFLKATGNNEAEEVALAGVSWVDLNTLQGDVRAGLPAGAYDVRVVSPAGTSGTEFAAYTVRDTQIDRISLEIDSVSHEVFEEAAVRIVLLDPSGEPTKENLDVRVLVEFPEGTPEVNLRAEGFASFEDLPNVVGFEGSLGDDGSATIYPSARVPGDYTLRVEARDDNERVQEDDVVLAWTRGSDLSVNVSLPSDDFETVAGVPFTATLTLVDQFGNPAPDAVASVFVTDTCGRWFDAVVVEGQEDVTVVATVATDPSATSECQAEAIQVRATGGTGVSGDSPPFSVRAGPLARFGVLAVLDGTSDVRAGDSVTLVVSPVDAWGNDAAWAGTITGISDGSGGVASFACAGAPVAVCPTVVTRAASQVRLTVTDADGIQGQASPFRVRSGQPTAVVIADGGLPWVAGEEEGLLLGSVDAWGNINTSAVFDLANVSVSDPRGEITCRDVAGVPGVIACALRTATSSTQVQVTLPVARDATSVPVVISGTLSGIEVQNGPLAAMTLTPSQSSVLAGEPLTVTAVGTDAYGNPYVVQSANAVTLSSSLGPVQPSTFLLNAAGRATVQTTLTRAGVTVLRADQESAQLGSSPAITVIAAPAHSLDVALRTPWAAVGDEVEVRLEVLDVYQNRVGLDFVADVGSRHGKATSVALPVTNGVGVGTLAWDAWDVADVVDAAPQSGVPALFGSSLPITIYERCGVAGPDVTMMFDGTVFGRVCLDDTTLVGTAQASFAGSSPQGSASLLRFGLAEGDAGMVSAAIDPTIEVAGAGAHSVRGFVLQDDGCGVEVSQMVYAGLEDGGAVGPVTVDPDAPSISLQGTTQTTVRVRDVGTCTGGPAAGASLHMRTDRGVLTGAVPTGQGLVLTLDAVAEGSVVLDVSGADMGGQASVTAWTPGGEAIGVGGVEVLGDARAPTVWFQSPEGSLAAPAEQIRVTMSEALDPASVAAASVTISGPSTRTATVGLDADDHELVIDLDAPLTAGAPGWSLVLPTSITDVAGNALSGTWSGLPAPYTGFVGTVASVDAVSACALDVSRFRPDGDDGPGEEADLVTLAFGAASAPAWWVIDVTGPHGVRVLHTQLVPAGAADAWTWDGRDATDAVVPAGTYALSVRGKGSNGNAGTACTKTLTVDLVEGAP